MRSRASVILVATAALASVSVDLGACGDKYFKVGQSSQIRRYAAIHRANLLVYQPAHPDAKGIKDFEKMLKGAGHKPVFVTHGSALAPVVTRGRYDLILVHYSDVASVVAQLQSVTARPDVVPILEAASRGLAAQAIKDYPFLITPDMTRLDALDQIEHVMERRLNTAQP